MKMRLVLGLALFFVNVGVFAQAPVSELNSRTFGILRGELDRAQEARSDFGSLEGFYLFGTLDNQFDLTAVGSTTTLPWIGFYRSGDLPLSAMFKLNLTPASSTPTGSTTVITKATKTITRTGTPPTETDELVDWIDQSVTTTYTRPISFTSSTDQLHTLVNLAAWGVPVVTGLDVIYVLNETDTTNNTTVVTSDFVDKTPLVLTAVPDVVKALEGTDTRTGLAITTTFQAQVPVAFSLAGLRHRASVYGNWAKEDKSTSRVDTGLAPVTDNNTWLAGTQTWTTANDATTNTMAKTDIGLNYEIGADLPKATAEAFDWTIGVFGSLILPKREYSISTDSNILTQTDVGNAATKTGDRTADTTTYVLANQWHTTVGLTAAAGFEVPLAPTLTWSSRPSIRGGWYNTSDSSTTLTSATRVEITDQNGDNDLLDLSDVRTTTTSTYTDAAFTNVAVGSGLVAPVVGGVVSQRTTYLNTGFPVALEFKPENWPIHFVVAANASMNLSLTSTSTKAYTVSTTAVEETGTGTAANKVTTITNTTASADSTSKVWAWTPSTAVSFLTRMDLGENVKLDIGLNSNQILAFESLKLQFTIALPAGKKPEPVEEEVVAPVVAQPLPAPVVAAPVVAGPPVGTVPGTTVPVAAPAPATTTAPKTTTTTPPKTTTKP